MQKSSPPPSSRKTVQVGNLAFIFPRKAWIFQGLMFSMALWASCTYTIAVTSLLSIRNLYRISNDVSTR